MRNCGIDNGLSPFHVMTGTCDVSSHGGAFDTVAGRLKEITLAPVAKQARDAIIDAGRHGGDILVCEHDAAFGYNNLVSDMRSLAIMRETRCPAVFDRAAKRNGLIRNPFS